MAQKLAAALRGLPGLRLLAEPEANGVFLDLSPATVAALTARGWHFYRFIGEHGHRLMCSWATPPEAVDRFISDLRAASR
jgi:threonine aldolase